MPSQNGPRLTLPTPVEILQRMFVLSAVFELNAELLRARRFGAATAIAARPVIGELGLLLFLGALTAWITLLFPWRLGIPGHGIFRAALPMMCGLALVPRCSAGTLMSCGAVGGLVMVLGSGLGHWQTVSCVSLLCLGPALDLATAGTLPLLSRRRPSESSPAGNANSPITRGREFAMSTPPFWPLYVRFAFAGVTANLIAFLARWGGVMLAGTGGPWASLQNFSWGILCSFVVCGALAGLLSGLVCFGLTADDE